MFKEFESTLPSMAAAQGTGLSPPVAHLRAACGPSRPVGLPARGRSAGTGGRLECRAVISGSSISIAACHAASGCSIRPFHNPRGRCQITHALPTNLGLFPSGQSQATVKLPALMLQLDADSAIRDDVARSAALSEAIMAGVTAVILTEGATMGASGLYEAACSLKAALRGRAKLLLVDRTDIAQAAEADGVLLTSQGALCVCMRSCMYVCACV